jgi:hypothetical protein
MGPREAMGTTLRADGAGNLAGDALDDVVFGAGKPVVTSSWVGTHGVPSASGRTAVHAPVLKGGSGDAVMYVVTADHALLLVSDPALYGRVLSGRMLRQVGPFGQGSLDGPLVAAQAANYDQLGYEPLNMAAITLFSSDGAGQLTIADVDVSAGGNQYHQAGIRYLYKVSANGQANIQTTPTVSGGKWYLVGPNTGLMLGYDAGVSIGSIMAQAAGPFTAGTVSGDYLVSQAPGGTLGSGERAGIATSSGNGMLSTVIDLNRAGTFTPGVAARATLAVGANGRALGDDGYVYYVVGPTRLLRLVVGNYDPSTWYPVIEQLDR